MPASPVSSKARRPARSMSRIATTVSRTFTTPTPVVANIAAEAEERPADWKMVGMPLAVNHVAVALPSREAWLRQLAFMQARGVKFDLRVEHGMTHSVYIHDPNGYGVELLYELPRELWGGDIDAALNFAVQLPTEGPEALQDRIEDVPVFKAPQAATV